MIPKELWIQNIVDVIVQIADPLFQEKAWVQGKTFLSISFNETVCQLYEDWKFEKFLKDCEQKKDLPEDLLVELKRLFKSLDIYINEHEPYSVNEVDMLKDPKWHQIQKKAQHIIDKFK